MALRCLRFDSTTANATRKFSLRESESLNYRVFLTKVVGDSVAHAMRSGHCAISSAY